MFKLTKEREPYAASLDLLKGNSPTGIIESVSELGKLSRSRWGINKIKEIKNVALPLAAGVVGGALGRVAVKELIFRAGFSFGTGFVGAVIGGAILGATVEAGKKTIEIGLEKYHKYQQEVPGTEKRNQATIDQWKEFYNEESAKFPVAGTRSYKDEEVLHRKVQERFASLNDERIANGEAPLASLDSFFCRRPGFLSYLIRDNLKGDLQKIGGAAVRGLIVGAVGGAAFDLALEFVQHTNLQLPKMEWKMPWDQGSSGGGQVDTGVKVSAAVETTFTPSPTETVMPTHTSSGSLPDAIVAHDAPVISSSVPVESTVLTDINKPLVSGSIIDNALTYDGQSWALMDNGVKNIGNLMETIGGVGVLDQHALAMQLQEATSLWAQGQLNPNSDLYQLFNLSNGTASVYSGLMSQDTFQSLRNLQIFLA